MDLPPEPPEWYHTIDLPHGRTSGLFDLDRVRKAVPWPDLTGLRCLDVATFDGYWAFEMERRGAAEVLALDVPRTREFDWVPRRRADAHDIATGAGFLHAAASLQSNVQRVEGNVYSLSADEVGTFDIVLMGALLLHLANPFAALERIRQVCHGRFISIEQVDERASLLMPRRGVVAIGDDRFPWVWGVPNRAGHHALLHHAGFDVEKQVHSVMDFGARVAPDRAPGRGLRHRLARRAMRLPDVPGAWASAIVARPAEGVASGDHLPIARRRLA
jgi:tRNA (mo5U34)-methyltransferase